MQKSSSACTGKILSMWRKISSSFAKSAKEVWKRKILNLWKRNKILQKPSSFNYLPTMRMYMLVVPLMRSSMWLVVHLLRWKSWARSLLRTQVTNSRYNWGYIINIWLQQSYLMKNWKRLWKSIKTHFINIPSPSNQKQWQHGRLHRWWSKFWGYTIRRRTKEY